MGYRILFLGQNWHGSCARACCYALRRAGQEVIDIDEQTYFPRLQRLSSRLLVRLFRPRLIREYNDRILELAHSFGPDCLLAFKGAKVEPETLRQLRLWGVRLYNYFPDPSAFAYGSLLPRSLPEYDCVFYTKKFWREDLQGRVRLRESKFVPHGYDSEVHCPHDLNTRDIQDFGVDLMVVATHSQQKERVLSKLVSLMGDVEMQIWGNQWDRCGSANLRKYIKGVALEGVRYAKALQACAINIALLRERVRGASQGDETTTRTFEIPASRGFMLHERSAEVLDLFEEGKEVECFEDANELAEKIRYYLAHPREREEIRRAGHTRCVPAYSYDSRMRQVIQWHTDSEAGGS